MNNFICICTEEYLGYYDILYKSIQKYCPNDEQTLYFIGKNVPTQYKNVINITEWFNNANPSYNTLERICSLRAQVVLDAFNRGSKKVIFCGAKLEFFKTPYELLIPLCGYNAVTTVHLLEPLPEDGKFPSNASVSFTGHISTDLIGFRNTPETWKFLMWQDEIMRNQCKTTKNTYLDQSWLNFLPCFVDNVKILRDNRYNVAYWNFDKCPIDDIICFQYSGIDLDNPKSISKHQNRYEAEGEFLQFLERYAKRVKEFK
jgi:hypothetical protein